MNWPYFQSNSIVDFPEDVYESILKLLKSEIFIKETTIPHTGLSIYLQILAIPSSLIALSLDVSATTSEIYACCFVCWPTLHIP